MVSLESISRHYRELTEEEKRASSELEQSFHILSIIKGLSSGERKAIYLSIRHKIECSNHFNALQKRWLGEHEFYIDWELIRKHLDHSHEVINRILTDEFLSWAGENVRFRIYYALMYPENIEQPYSPEFSALLEEVETVRRAN